MKGEGKANPKEYKLKYFLWGWQFRRLNPLIFSWHRWFVKRQYKFIYLFIWSIIFQAAVHSKYTLWFSTYAAMIQGLLVEEVVLNQRALSTINNKLQKSNWKKTPYILTVMAPVLQPQFSTAKASSGSFCSMVPQQNAFLTLLHTRQNLFADLQGIMQSIWGEWQERENWILRHLFDLSLWWFRLIYMMGLGCVCYGLRFMQCFLWLDSQWCSVSCISWYDTQISNK